jgi:hypothetical protein
MKEESTYQSRKSGMHSWRARVTHFHPAVLRRREYILPMSPMPIMPMLRVCSMAVVVIVVWHAALRVCRVGVQPMVQPWTKDACGCSARS